MKKLAIVGTVPPPFGGVSVHVKRKLALLREHGLDVTLYEQTGKSDAAAGIAPLPGGRLGFVKWLIRFQEPWVHFHFNKHAALALAANVIKVRRGKSYSITIHSERPVREFHAAGGSKQRTMRNYFRGAKHLICVSQPIADFMLETLKVEGPKVSVLPAYLPPSADELAKTEIPEEVANFVRSRSRIIGSHGWFGYFVDGQHVYGFEHLARLAAEIAARRQENVGLYTVISGVYEEEHRAAIMQLQEPLKDHWLIVEQPFSCAALYQKTDLFVRPTVTDGDSVSIRECLDLQVPVLASDAVNRPAQCHLFPVGDYQQFAKSTWELILNRDSKPQAASANFEQPLVDIFRQLLAKD